jgi:coproporphyrinogen III oxidase
MSRNSYQKEMSEFLGRAQLGICMALERCDGTGRFTSDRWKRPHESGGEGGGGVSKLLTGGRVFEQAGVNISEVQGVLPPEMAERLTGVREPLPFHASGLSLVIHPHSPMVPTTHANVRYLEVGDKQWFGGGADLTPYYLFEEDARHFHVTLKETCDRFDRTLYPAFKKECDEYFYLPHRGEGRGIGGIFFDYLGRNESAALPMGFELVKALAHAFEHSYVPIVERRRHTPWGEREKHFQLLRRGRYIEFNLLYDRGTLFGLKTGGRIESIFMSFPPEARWEYRAHIEPGSPEYELLEVLKHPRDWTTDDRGRSS